MNSSDFSYSSWQPNPGVLQQVLQTLSDPTHENAAENYALLEHLKGNAEFPVYLVYVFSILSSHPVVLRSRAGLKLKGNIKADWESFPRPMKEFFKYHILQCVADPNQFIRGVSGTLIATIAAKETLAGWPGLLGALAQLIEGNQPNAIEGAFHAISKLCEDIPNELCSLELESSMASLVPTLIRYFLHPSAPVRKFALTSAVALLQSEDTPEALENNLASLLQNLFEVATKDKSREIRKRVVQGFCGVADLRPELMHPQMENIIRFMIEASADSESSIAIEACEFWTIYTNHECNDLELLRKYLDPIIQALLKGMIYEESDVANLLGDGEEDEHVEDRSEDIRPHFHSSRMAGGGEDDEEDWGEDGEASQWNLRKCAAANLDRIAVIFKHHILQFLLPALSKALSSIGKTKAEDETLWLIRESGILALGAVAEGCYDGMKPHLHQLVPYLLSLLGDQRPLVRSITCWTLSRYASFVVEEVNDELFLKPLIIEMLKRILDKNKKVQEAACAAFATIESEAGNRLVPYLQGILQSLMFAFTKYQAKNLILLYDAISTLAEAVREKLNEPSLTAILLPPLLNKWNILQDDDRDLFPLLECLTSIAQALGLGFAKYSPPIFARCIQLIELTLTQNQIFRAALEADPNTEAEPADKEFMVCALDLLSGLSDGLGASIQPLVDQSPSLMGLLYSCLSDPDPDVRQSAFALLGDLAKSCIGVVAPFIESFIPVACANLNPLYSSVCNNASWAIAEISVKAGNSAMAPFVNKILDYLIPILNENMESPLQENTALTVGRICCVCAPEVSTRLPQFSGIWLAHLARTRQSNEKSQAFQGLCAVVQANPTAVLNCFPQFCTAVASFRSSDQTVLPLLLHLMHAFKSSLGSEDWNQRFSAAEPKVQQFLTQHYKL